VSFRFSRFGEHFDSRLGTLSLMQDLGDAAENPDTLMLGGGNPARIPAVETRFADYLTALSHDTAGTTTQLAAYADPAGDRRFRRAVVTLLNREYGFGISERNVCLSNGSQNGFFALMNLLGGTRADGSLQRILLPMTPEYLGYADLWVDQPAFVAHRPTIELLDDRLFKYRVDFDAISIGDDIGALCLSRPTNPTGNVVTDDELNRLDRMAQAANVPLIVDNAYGEPFPGITARDITPTWNDNTVLCMSLSKVGLPGVRTGIIVAHHDIVERIAAMNAVMNLAPGNFGPTLMADAVENGDILRLAREHIRPHYQAISKQAVNTLLDATAGTPVRLHKPEGAIFLWLWAPDLGGTAEQLYQRLKSEGVVVVAGHHFFPGLEGDWTHRHECLRISFAGGAEPVAKAAPRIARAITELYP